MNNIKFFKGNIFTSKCQTLVNTVNCVGVMGAGIALEFKFRYPKMYSEYVKHCKNKLIEIGKLWIYNSSDTGNKVMNFPTKAHWRNPSKYEYLEKGLARFVETYSERGITSVAFPLLGALNGGLDPNKVLDLMRQYLSNCDIPIEIYEYDPTAKDELIDSLRAKFLSSDLDFLENVTLIKKPVLMIMIDAMRKNEVCSMIQLAKLKGVSDYSAELCYAFAIKNKSKHNEESVKELLLFDKEESEKFDLVDDAVNKISDDRIKAPQKVKKVTTRVPKRKDLLQATLEEKILLTGLAERIILSIENRLENEFSLYELKSYCKGLNVDLTKFFKENFAEKIKKNPHATMAIKANKQAVSIHA